MTEEALMSLSDLRDLSRLTQADLAQYVRETAARALGVSPPEARDILTQIANGQPIENRTALCHLRAWRHRITAPERPA